MEAQTLYQLDLDMFLSAGAGVVALLLGIFLTGKLKFLSRLCIPTPVTGGILLSLLTLAVYCIGEVEISFDPTLKDLCMMIFFTSVGYQSNLREVKRGGKPLAVLVILVSVLIVMQNLLSTGISASMGLGPLTGMAMGSIPMCGGHGTAGGFSSLLESMGVESAASLSMAAATFGLVAGSLLGGPLAERLIRTRDLAQENPSPADVASSMDSTEASPHARERMESSEQKEFRRLSAAVFQLLLAMAAGSLLSKALALTGITFPTYFGSLIAAAIIRNVCESVPGVPSPDMDKITLVGNVCLSLFLGMAMSSLKLWELAALALPLTVILLSQVVLIALFGYFVAFPLLGKDYDAALLVSGLAGFGLGATPNAMANMSAVCNKYRYAVKPFIIVPLVGAMFVDIINTTVITIFLNVL